MTPTAVWLMDGGHIAAVEGHDFEQFCLELLDVEVSLRHVGGRVAGGAGEYVGDEGIDLQVEVAAPPRIPKIEFARALTDDEPGITCVSCKSGRHWRDQLVRDARRAPRPVEVLRGGGRFTIIVNQRVSEPVTNRAIDKVARLLAGRLGDTPERVARRLTLLDADDLAGFLAHHPVVLDRRLADQLRLPALPGLLTFEEWRRFQEHERQLPGYRADDDRQRALEAIGTLCSRDAGVRSGRVLWMSGPPGVGKSRLVLEALAAVPGLSRRTWIAPHHEHGRHAVEATDLPRHNDVVVVVDDCPASRVGELAAAFATRAEGAHATLIVVGPQDPTVPAPSAVDARVELGPLAGAAAERLIADELTLTPGERPDLVQHVAHLAEGYPWFAVLLARALRDEPGALAERTTQWEAAKIAIAGRPRLYGDDQVRYEGVVRLRSRALFATILTEGVSWRGLRPQDTDRLSRALGAPWEELVEAAEDCHRRGLLRVREDWTYKYVTPNNLGRLVATLLLGPPHWIDGRIREHVPELRPGLYRRLEFLDVEPGLLARLALAELTRPPPDQDTRPAAASEAVPLRLLATWHPAGAARRVRADVEARPIDALRADVDGRRDLVIALGHICHRRDGFEDAEVALFRLAVAENESWSNNATGVWSSLFLAALNLTYRSAASRLAILRDRVRSGPAEYRLLALEGLKAAVSDERAISGATYADGDTVDGPWLRPTIGEVIEGKRSAWRLLHEAMTDADAAVAAKARGIAVSSVRAAARWRILSDALGQLASMVAEWPADELARLRDKLQALETFDARLLEADPGAAEALRRLRDACRPRTYHDRLLDVVGRWNRHVPVEHHREHEEQQDRDLALEGIAPPRPLLGELAWLDSDEAVRVTPFAIRVGTLDAERTVLVPLVERARAGAAVNALPAYLLGLARAGAEEDVDAVLRGWREIPELALHTMLAVARLGATDERVGWIVEDLRAGRVDPKATAWLGLGGWGRGGSAAAMRELIEALATSDDPAALVTALDLIHDRHDRPAADPDEFARLAPTTSALVRRLATVQIPAMADHVWEQGCRLLLARGEALVVAQAAIAALRSADRYGSDLQAWDLLGEALAIEPRRVWAIVGAVLEAKDGGAYRFILEASSTGLLRKVPAEVVLDWIATDSKRATAVARICTAHEAPLNDLARQLIARFGATGGPARALASQAHSTLEAVWGGVSRFYESQLGHARQWQHDSDPEVARWGAAQLHAFESVLRREEAREEYERRQG